MPIRSSLNSAAAVLCLHALSGLSGCVLPLETIDRTLCLQARQALGQERPRAPRGMEEDDEMLDEEEEPAPTRSVVVAELLAIFPGFFWHGLGHQYAGDHRTARDLRRAGAWGYILTAVGGGLFVGGYFLDDESANFFNDYDSMLLYIGGGMTGGAGVGIFLAVWFFDMIDTPRAVRTGGRPPPHSPFTRDLFDFGDE